MHIFIYLVKMNRFLFLLLLASAATAQQHTAQLGDLPLEGGQTLKACHLGYRTYGELNKDRTNAILFPSWYGGTAKDIDLFQRVSRHRWRCRRRISRKNSARQRDQHQERQSPCKGQSASQDAAYAPFNGQRGPEAEPLAEAAPGL